MRSAEISPEPGEAEREAILAALAAEEQERRRASRWAEALLPGHGSEGEEP